MADHGVGIPARDLERIFERFYRVDHGRSRDTGGTGLGLSIVRHVASNHQGRVEVDSREGEGSTFTLVLPCSRSRAADNATGPRAGEDHADQRPPGRGRRVLRRRAAVGLGREGFDVHVARDGTEALRLFESVEPDLVLLDLMLPRALRHRRLPVDPGPSSVPIIMVTAKGTEIDTVVGLEVGADDYVTKPYRLRELVARMRAVSRRTPPPPPATVGDRRRRADDGQLVVGRRSTVDADQRRVFVRGDEVHLRRKEFELLHLLIENAGRVLTRDVLIDRVWGPDYIGDTKTLDVHIKRLRSHVEEDPSEPDPDHHDPRGRLPLRRLRGR